MTQWLKEKFNTTICTPKKCETGIHIHILLLDAHALKGLKDNWGYSINHINFKLEGTLESV